MTVDLSSQKARLDRCSRTARKARFDRCSRIAQKARLNAGHASLRRQYLPGAHTLLSFRELCFPKSDPCPPPKPCTPYRLSELPRFRAAHPVRASVDVFVFHRPHSTRRKAAEILPLSTKRQTAARPAYTALMAHDCNGRSCHHSKSHPMQRLPASSTRVQSNEELGTERLRLRKRDRETQTHPGPRLRRRSPRPSRARAGKLRGGPGLRKFHSYFGGTWLSKTVRGSELARQGFGAGRQGQNAAGQAARLCQQMLAV